MNTLELLKKTNKDKWPIYQVQVLLDVISAYFDVPIRLVNPEFEKLIEDVIDSKSIKQYEEYRKLNIEEKIKSAFIKEFKEIELDPILNIVDQVYLNKSSNNSALSFRLELHREWMVLKLLEDYVVLSGYKNNESNDPIQYITDDFFIFIKYCDELDTYLINGPFLRLKEKSHFSNEDAIKKFIALVRLILNNANEIYPSYGEYLKLGSEFFSCTESTARRQTELAFDSIINSLKIIIDEAHPAYFLKETELPVLGKRHWIFFAFSSIFISRYRHIGPNNKLITLYHSYKDDSQNVKCAQLTTKIKEGEIQSSQYLASSNKNKKYLDLNTDFNNNNFFYEKRKKLFNFLCKKNTFDRKTRETMWEQSFISVIKQAEKNINFISDKRIAILEEYLSDNWQKYLNDDENLSKNICMWVNTIIRGVETFLYEYSYKENKLVSYACSSVLACSENAEEGLEEANKLDIKSRSSHSIAYRCIYKENRQYVHFQSLDSKPIAMPFRIPEKNRYFWRIVVRAQSSIAHTLTYNGRALGVIEIQGDQPYYFRHYNLYKLRQFSTFFGDYFYRAKANAWLQDIIDSASNDDHAGAYKKQCEALTNLFLASGAGIWIRDASINGAYQLKGFYGSDRINELLEIEPDGNFFRSNTNSEGSEFLKKRVKATDRDSFFIAKPYAPSKVPNAYKQALSEEKFDHILLFAINNINDTSKPPHAVITIHNKSQTHNDSYPKTWGRDIAHISQFVASAFSIMHSVSEQERIKMNLLSHDLRTNIGQLNSNATLMLKKVNDSAITPKNKIKYINFVVKNDLQPIVEESIQQIEALSVGKKETAKKAFFNEIQRYQKIYLKLSDIKQYTNFLAAYNKAFETRERIGAVYFKPLVGKADGWLVKISVNHLNKVLINLIQNAQKYSSSESPVETQIYEEFDTLVFEMKNKGKQMQVEEEAFRVFDYKFRGTNAMTNKGEGLGLWQVKHIVELYNASIFFNYSELPNVNLAEYNVKIQFHHYK